jgi:hypothetical protein
MAEITIATIVALSGTGGISRLDMTYSSASGEPMASIRSDATPRAYVTTAAMKSHVAAMYTPFSRAANATTHQYSEREALPRKVAYFLMKRLIAVRGPQPGRGSHNGAAPEETGPGPELDGVGIMVVLPFPKGPAVSGRHECYHHPGTIPPASDTVSPIPPNTSRRCDCAAASAEPPEGPAHP